MTHAADRALERYGIVVYPRDERAIVADIVAGRALLMGRQPNGLETWLARFEGTTMKVVYNPRTAVLVTVVPIGKRAKKR